MIFIALLIATIAFVEMFARLRILDRATVPAELAQRSFRIIRAERISDHWKERVLPAYSLRMMLATLQLSGFLIIAFSPFLVALIIAKLVDLPLLAELASWRGILFSSAIAIVYLYIRKRLATG